MTALGKILVFFNLLFALVTGGLVVQVYLTSTNWRVAHDAAVADAKAAQAALNGERAVTRQNKANFDVKLTELESQIANLRKDLGAAKVDAEAAKVAKQQAVQIAETQNVNAQSATAEIDKLRTERDQMQLQLNQRNDRIAKLETDNANLLAKATFSGIRADLTEKEIEEKKVELSNLNRQVAEMKAELNRLGGLRERAMANKPRVPAVDEKGTVTSVADNLAVISLGSDHGIEPGHILQVYRTNPTPQYLGTLTINRTETHRAVGLFQPTGRNATVQVGDTVDTKVLR